ncbi:MAG: RNA polymerase sigma factor [Steroidobacteraceae bacterium]
MRSSEQDETYQEASAAYGAALSRLVRGYEAAPEKQGDLLQEIHIAIWKSLGRFNGSCSLRTWVFRVAHNVAASHVLRERRRSRVSMAGLDELDDVSGAPDSVHAVAEYQALARLTDLIRQLIPIDRQVILSYLEGMDAGAISELTGLSASNVATKVHRIKEVLRKRFEARELR